MSAANRLNGGCQNSVGHAMDDHLYIGSWRLVEMQTFITLNIILHGLLMLILVKIAAAVNVWKKLVTVFQNIGYLVIT